MEQRTRVIEEFSDSQFISAAWQGRAHTVAFHLWLGEVNINSRDASGRTPLHMAAIRGNQVMAEMLLTNGAQVNAEDADGWTPLRWATASGSHEVSELLRKYGAH